MASTAPTIPNSIILCKKICVISGYFIRGSSTIHVDTNAHGFRGPDWDLSANRKNVVILGDSFAFGWGVQWEQTIGKILEKELQKTDPAYQVINLAMPGMGY